MAMSEKSSCWRCGKELESGQVECEYGCGQQLQAPADPVLIFQIIIHYDKNKIQTPEEILAWQKSVQRFGQMLGEIFINSGVSSFCKKPQ